jgi:hypothetical protein
MKQFFKLITVPIDALDICQDDLSEPSYREEYVYELDPADSEGDSISSDMLYGLENTANHVYNFRSMNTKKE